ncbi:MAG: response regulator [Sporomusaceae bacterium]|nr:response regulator [Sporomusaceae bacterium]
MSKSKSTVLVVDDQPGIRRLLMEVLTEEGYLVYTAANGYEGVQKAKELKPTMILMDMKMPGMDGIETLRELKHLNQADKVIMMTAYGELGLVNVAKELGAYAYVTKPFDIIDLCTMIGQLISTSMAECELRIG